MCTYQGVLQVEGLAIWCQGSCGQKNLSKIGLQSSKPMKTAFRIWIYPRNFHSVDQINPGILSPLKGRSRSCGMNNERLSQERSSGRLLRMSLARIASQDRWGYCESGRQARWNAFVSPLTYKLFHMRERFRFRMSRSDYRGHALPIQAGYDLLISTPLNTQCPT